MNTSDLQQRLKAPKAWATGPYSPPPPAGYERDNAPFEAADALALQGREIAALLNQVASSRVVIAGLDRRAVDLGREHGQLSARAADVAGERAANEMLGHHADYLRAELDRWKSEAAADLLVIAELRKDAERYRKLRDSPISDVRIIGIGKRAGAELDDAADAMAPVLHNVRAEAGPTAGRQARAGENVPRTARPGLASCRWASPRARG